MSKRTFVLLLALPLCLTIFPGRLSAGIISPGIYRGYFFVDRWGQAVLNHGTSYAFVSDAMAARLRKHEGAPIELKVTKILQPMNPGAGMIMEAEDPVLVTSPLMSLQIKLAAQNVKVVQGQGMRLTIACKNASKDAISVWPGALQVFLITNRPFANKDIGYRDPQDLAYWYHQHYYLDRAPRRTLVVACRADRVPWSADDMTAHGKNLTTKREPEKYNGNVLVFGPGAEFTDDLVIGKQLLPREYEVFIYVDSNFPCPMSNRIAFDVVKDQEKEP